jgi:hypothetical protein
MKTALFLLLVCGSIHTFGQSTPELPPKRILFKLSPQHFTQNTLKAGGEFFNKEFSRSFVVYFSAAAGNNPNDYFYYSDYEYSGLSGELQYRKYISPVRFQTSKRGREYYQGIYFSGFVQGIPVYVVEYNYHESVGNFAFGFTLGVQRTLWKVLLIDLYVGGGLQLSDIIRSGQVPQAPYYFYYGGISNPSYNGILPKFGLQIGIGL